MAGLNAVGDGLHAVAWEVKRLARVVLRRAGVPGVVAAGGLVVAIAAVWVDQHSIAVLSNLQHQLVRTQADSVDIRNVAARPQDDGRQRLAAFDHALPAHDEIPQAVGELLMLAENENLLVDKGDYRLQLDPQGGFVRYRMTLPVKGDASAVRRFILASLRGQRTLALESVQFKREGAGSRALEARIQWVLLARATTARSSTRPTATLQAMAEGAAR
ncbi:hypothetical protein SAMN05216359_111110 [Roseateles sp. YR242]|uniref:hypothetical protein n=1 Tax=Roseateles sp. YR242 TaxID=1855305 RepID=UPI0008C1F779|nr:hypothetical protein [Roseateles sp. YR242]SEL57581.1 hypothetical protein SAMN05216359_111110 [Roseateles sp. YR242]